MNIHPRLIGDYWYLCVVVNGKLYAIHKIGLAGNCLPFC